MLYHASNIHNLQYLKPNKSTHGGSYVYVIKNKVTAVCFGAPKDDFDILMDEEDGVPVLFECYPDAFKKVYKGKSCSLYTVEEEQFVSGRTGWDSELVSENTIQVLNEDMILDIYDYIIEAANRNECILNLYSDSESYQHMLKEELEERIKDFGLSKEQMANDNRFELYFSKIVDI
ncbi:MAG: hypothetical protein IKW81_02480 [Pseudobutyrivibrio sp.]|nr:hypothetical protein [Pseudobutyrivibrio sp.]